MVKLTTKLDPAQAQLQLKVTLGDIRPAIWRRLLLPANVKLPTFHAVLQHAFDWTDSHLHAFRIGDQSYEAYHPEFWDESPHGPRKLDESAYRLCDLLHAKGDRLTYLYDFGDGWRHDVRVEKIVPAKRPAPITCPAGARAAPPEESGRFACRAANFSSSPKASLTAASWASRSRVSPKVIAMIETDFWALH